MEIIKITNKNYKNVVKNTADLIKSGKVVIFPTDTVYGFLCDAGNKKAVGKIFTIKKRNKKNPLPLFVKNIKMAKILAVIDNKQEELLKKYWPGRITVVLKRRGEKKIYGVDKQALALRIPKYNFLNILLNEINLPLVQTSANISGELPIKNAKEAIKQFNNKKRNPDLIIDGGVLMGKSSKIIDLTVFPYKTLRS